MEGAPRGSAHLPLGGWRGNKAAHCLGKGGGRYLYLYIYIYVCVLDMMILYTIYTCITKSTMERKYHLCGAVGKGAPLVLLAKILAEEIINLNCL